MGKQIRAVDARPDTHDMVVIHRIFRHGFPELAALVRDVAPGDRGRADAVAVHAEFLLNGLEYHHAAEDEHLWPRLLERVPQDADAIHRMDEEHRELADHLDRARRLLAEWRHAPGGAELADELQQLGTALSEHLDEEEADMLPLVQAHLTADEWQALGEGSFDKFTNAEKLVATGQMIDVATPQEAAMFMGKLPGPIRLMWRVVGHRRYQRYIRTVRGTR